MMCFLSLVHIVRQLVFKGLCDSSALTVNRPEFLWEKLLSKKMCLIKVNALFNKVTFTNRAKLVWKLFSL